MRVHSEFGIKLYRFIDPHPFMHVPLITILLSCIMWWILAALTAYRLRSYQALLAFTMVFVMYGLLPPPQVDASCQTMMVFLRWIVSNGIEVLYAAGIYNIIRTVNTDFQTY